MDRLTALLTRLKGLHISRPRLIAGVVFLALLVWGTSGWLAGPSDRLVTRKPSGTGGPTDRVEQRLLAVRQALQQRTGLGAWEPFDYAHDARAGEKFVALMEQTRGQPSAGGQASPSSGLGLLDFARQIQESGDSTVRQARPARATQEATSLDAFDSSTGSLLPQLYERQNPYLRRPQWSPRPMFDSWAAQQEAEAASREVMRDLNLRIYGGP